jgi:hypothetical protein
VSQSALGQALNVKIPTQKLQKSSNALTSKVPSATDSRLNLPKTEEEDESATDVQNYLSAPSKFTLSKMKAKQGQNSV